MNDQELIVAAAEKVCGWEIMPVKQFLRMRGIPHADTVVELEGVIYRRDARDHFVIAWNPLESISDAWMLVEALIKKGHSFTLNCQDSTGEPKFWGAFWNACFSIKPYFAGGNRTSDPEYFHGHDDNPNRAITLASLKALGEGKA